MSIALIFNPNAGSADQMKAVREAIQRHPAMSVLETKEPSDTARFTREAIESGAEVIVAGGGDGTVNHVASEIIKSERDVTFGIVPMGTGNDLARTLQIPLDAVQAIDLLEAGERRTIDVIKVKSEDRVSYSLNVAAGGFSGQLDEVLTDGMKKSWGPLSYLLGAMKVFPDLQKYRTTIRFDGKAKEPISALNIIVANARTAGGGKAVAPSADPEDGLLDVVIVRPGSLANLAGVLARLVAGDYTNSDLVTHRRATRVSVESTPGMWFNVDGELLTNQPVSFTILPKRLRVIVGEGHP